VPAACERQAEIAAQQIDHIDDVLKQRLSSPCRRGARADPGDARPGKGIAGHQAHGKNVIVARKKIAMTAMTDA
jgi:hypothetical protein